jgi:hypothetical protein
MKIERHLTMPKWFPPLPRIAIDVRLRKVHEHIAEPVDTPEFGTVMVGRCQDSLHLQVGRFSVTAGKLIKLPRELRGTAALQESLSEQIGERLSQEIHSGLGWPEHGPDCD